MHDQPERFPVDPVRVKEGEIPLPPQEMWEELDNSATSASAAAPQKKPERVEAERLKFTGGKAWSTNVLLDFPFEYDGQIVSSITIRRLTTAEMGEIIAQHGADFDQWDIFAAMTGLPASILRGLESGDGDAVTEVAYDFLPRSLKKGG